MPLCALCSNNEADKTGSHLIPHFLMKKVDNNDNKNGRDLELGFMLGSKHVRPYFGRGIQPEKLEEVFGDISDDLIENAKSNMIVDHLLCTKCESRIGVVENEYAKTLARFDDVSYKSTDDPLTSMFFWLSIFWRLSVSANIDFTLSPKEESRIKNILDRGLNFSEDFQQNHTALISRMRYKVIRAVNYTEAHSGFLFINSNHTRPYCIMIGEFAVFLYIIENHEKGAAQSFLGLENLLKHVPTNSYNVGEFIYPVDEEAYDLAIEKGNQFYAADFMGGLSEMVDNVYEKMGVKGQMNPEIKNEILNEIVFDDGPLGNRYTPETMTKAIMKVLTKHVKFMEED